MILNLSTLLSFAESIALKLMHLNSSSKANSYLLIKRDMRHAWPIGSLEDYLLNEKFKGKANQREREKTKLSLCKHWTSSTTGCLWSSRCDHRQLYCPPPLCPGPTGARVPGSPGGMRVCTHVRVCVYVCDACTCVWYRAIL